MFNKVVMVLLLASVIGQAHARTGHKYVVELGDAVHSEKVPAASSLVTTGDGIFAVSDMSPFLYKLDKAFNVDSLTTIKQFPAESLTENGTLGSDIKPDYESMTLVPFEEGKAFLILGSGSKAMVREWGYLVSQDHSKIIERSLTPLYSQLHKAGNFTEKQEFNIEGLAVANEHTYILNRGNFGDNLIFEVKTAELVEYMLGGRDQVEHLVVKKVILPRMHGFEAGLSGATYSEKLDSLVFTASIEAASNINKKGYILGSFIGVLPMVKYATENEIDLTFYSAILQKDGKAVLTKAESLMISEDNENYIKGALVCDNDDGSSEFFHFNLKRNQ
ncbi:MULTISPECIES: hypothetical protein [unclassified Motilimonas]|uniref:DUF6929 family protein n=1 Tax=unclassified Motilimonas TaxID=2643697 RepID=UPI001E298D8B|nr:MULTISPECIES: hypothetical protein [unclassified Motilimonas]MCE0555649.1 hypothetical protein [Motilimonas sp. E26]MDO6526683.1 hypothetical protein [Motilimonas sp. 1_MG-2023]